MFTDLQIPAGRRPLTKNEALASAAVAIAFTLLIAVDVLDEFTTAKLGVVFVLAFWAPLLVLHELGHTLAAKALGWQVREIVIGFGRTLWETRIGGTRIRIKLVPVEGYVLPAPVKRDHMRSKSLLVYAAGPGAELLLLGILLGVFGTQTVFNDSDAIALVALESLAIAIVLGAGFNLLPFRVGAGVSAGVSDGLGMLLAPFTSEETVDLRLAALDLSDARKMMADGDTGPALEKIRVQRARYPGNEALALTYAAALSADGRTDEARDLVRGRLAQIADGSVSRVEWHVLQARIEIEASEPAFLTLDLALQKALELKPAAPNVLAAKGVALVMRGRAEAGGALLADAWRRNDGSADDAEMLAYLAIAARQAGDAAASRRFSSAFAAVNKSRRLADRVRARLTA
jgi:Peptidase family M50